MALADVLSELQREGDEEIARIVAERDASVAAILDRARHDADDAAASAAASRHDALARDADVIRHRAELAVERRLREAAEVIVQDILGRAEDRLSHHRSEPGYPATLDALVAECVEFLGTVRVVMADERDAELVREIVDRRGLDADVLPSLATWGGIDAGDGQGAFVRNTLEERLGRAEAALRHRIGDMIPGLRRATESGAA